MLLARAMAHLSKRRWTVATGSALLLCGCAGTVVPAATPAPPVPIPTTQRLSPVGLERVMGHDERALVALFGRPDADVREGTARKLQFAGPICVLDAYLYPKGSGAPMVTYVDARQLNGSPIDRASCIAALVRR